MLYSIALSNARSNAILNAMSNATLQRQFAVEEVAVAGADALHVIREVDLTPLVKPQDLVAKFLDLI